MTGLKLDIPEMQPGEEKATEKQKGFIQALLRDVGGSGFPEETLEDLGKWQASSIIDQLQSFQRQLAGDKPLDTSKLTDADGGSDKSTPTWVWISIAIVIIIKTVHIMIRH